MQSLLQHRFAIGLALGLAAALVVWVRALLARRALLRELENLKGSLYTKLTIETKAQMAREGELESLRKQNENLRITIAGLAQKAGRAELRQLHVYDRALHAMLASAPGFAPAWETVLRTAEEEIAASETGVTAFVRKVFVTQLPRRATKDIELPPASDDDS